MRFPWNSDSHFILTHVYTHYVIAVSKTEIDKRKVEWQKQHARSERRATQR
jgi:hypothetical protein